MNFEFSIKMFFKYLDEISVNCHQVIKALIQEWLIDGNLFPLLAIPSHNHNVKSGAKELEFQIARYVQPLEVGLLANGHTVLFAGAEGPAVVGLSQSPGGEAVQ